MKKVHSSWDDPVGKSFQLAVTEKVEAAEKKAQDIVNEMNAEAKTLENLDEKLREANDILGGVRV